MKKIILLVCILILSIPEINFSGVLKCINSTSIVNVTAAGDSGLIMRSSNSGITWNEFRITNENFKCIFYTGITMFTGSQSGKLYVLNPDNSLNVIFNFSPAFSINSIFFVNPDIGYVCGSGGYVYKTINAGVNWTLVNSGITNITLNSMFFINSETGYAAGINGKVFYTSNGGSSWIEEVTGSTADLSKIIYASGKVYACGKEGVLLVKESGWSPVNTKVKSDIRGIAKSGNNIIHICGGGGFIKNNSADPGFSKFEINPSFGELSDLFFFENRGWAVSNTGKAILRTTDNGTTWSLQQNVSNSFIWVNKVQGLGNALTNTLSMNPKNRNSVYVMYSDDIFATYDKGENFRQVSRLNLFDTCNTVSFVINPADTNIWMTVSYKNIVGYVLTRSTDHGNTWNIVLDKIEFATSSTPVEISKSNPNIVYYVNQGGGFYKSTNSGQSFTKISNYPFRSPYDLIVK